MSETNENRILSKSRRISAKSNKQNPDTSINASSGSLFFEYITFLLCYEESLREVLIGVDIQPNGH